jgi:hypothetical protein
MELESSILTLKEQSILKNSKLRSEERQRLASFTESQKIKEELEASPEQPSSSISSKSFKESESVVTSASVMLPPITPIVKDESHGESSLPVLRKQRYLF